jgi:hypothetical protein
LQACARIVIHRNPKRRQAAALHSGSPAELGRPLFIAQSRPFAHNEVCKNGMAKAATHPRRRRRIFSFTLRTLLIAFTVASLWFGWRVNRSHRQRAAAQAIVAYGGAVSYDYEYDPSTQSFLSDRSPPDPPWLVETVGVDMLQHVEYANLWVGRSDVAEEETAMVVAALDDLPQLRVLYLCGEQATDETMEKLSAMKNLEELFIFGRRASIGGQDANPAVTAKGLEQLTSLAHLRSITIDGAALDDESLAALGRIRNLEQLHLYGESCYFTDEGLAGIGGLSRLTDATLATQSLLCVFGDDGLRHLGRMNSLMSVKLRGANFSEEVLAELKSSAIDVREWRLFDVGRKEWVFTGKGYRRTKQIIPSYVPVVEKARQRIDRFDALSKRRQHAQFLTSLRETYFAHDADLGAEFLARAATLQDPSDERIVSLVRELRSSK